MANSKTTRPPDARTNSEYERQLREINEALLVSSIRQQELAEQAQRAEAAMRESEERFRTLFELGPVAAYSCDASGVIQQYNRRAAELWGRAPALGDTDERFCGSFRMIRPDGSVLAHEQCPMAEVLVGTIPHARNAEVQIDRPDGSRVTVVVNIRPLKNEQGEITGAINCFHDITERKQAENTTRQQATELADLHRRKDEFLAMLSHELRNPLAPIANAVQLLRLEKNPGAIQEQARTIIERQVGQLSRLIEDLMEVSRLSTGRIHLEEERLDLRGVIDRAVETVRPLIVQRRHALTVVLSKEPIWLIADAGRLEQVMINLLTNAAKYTDPAGQIWLSVDQAGDEGVVRVRDTGIGIAPELLPRVFDVFTQAERSLDRAQGGLGIGLALVRQIVQLHHGRVEAISVPGQGSEFVVRLPIVLSPASPKALSERQPDFQNRSSCRVLVVDDNVDMAHSLTMLLLGAGYEVRTAHDGPGALAAALDFQPQAVFLDIGLPELNGYEVAHRLRAEPGLESTLLVAVTGYGQASDEKRSEEAGFSNHLVKPVDFRRVLQLLATIPTEAT